MAFDLMIVEWIEDAFNVKTLTCRGLVTAGKNLNYNSPAL